MGSRLLSFIVAGAALAEVVGFGAFGFWTRDYYAVGLAMESLLFAVLGLAIMGGLVGAAAYLLSKPRNVG
jgi:hypothetical protein